MLSLVMRLRLTMKVVLLLLRVAMALTVFHEYATTLHHPNLSRQLILTPLIGALNGMLRVRVQLWICIDLT